METHTTTESMAAARVLLVDDDPDMRDIVSRTLRRAGFWNVSTLDGPEHVVQHYVKDRPDLLLIDYRLPPTDGIEVLKLCRAHDGESISPPAVMLTGSGDEEVKRQALEVGVSDFLQKDCSDAELVLRLRNVLRSHHLLVELSRQKTWLEECLRLRTAELHAAQRDVLERLAAAIDFRDDITGGHIKRVGQLSRLVAEFMGGPGEFSAAIETAALLHDVGKIGIPDGILMKPGALTPDERRLMERHCALGAQMLEGATEPVLAMAKEIALTHHERWDGQGYPQGLKGGAIPLSGRIVAVVDAYDAMTNDRPYRQKISHDEATNELLRAKGTQFDPMVVDSFLAVTRAASGASIPTSFSITAWLAHSPT